MLANSSGTIVVPILPDARYGTTLTLASSPNVRLCPMCWALFLRVGSWVLLPGM
jgi:hypothetical protein